MTFRYAYRPRAEDSVHVTVADPHAEPAALAHEYGIELREPSGPYDVIISTVAHDGYRAMDRAQVDALGSEEYLLFDLKGLYTWGRELGNRYWKL